MNVKDTVEVYEILNLICDKYGKPKVQIVLDTIERRGKYQQKK